MLIIEFFLFCVFIGAGLGAWIMYKILKRMEKII